MLRSITRVVGLALALGVLALAPLTALADHTPGYTADEPGLYHGTVATPEKGDPGGHRSYQDEDEPWPGSADDWAGYAMDPLTAVERIAVAGHLTWTMDTIRFLEANVWEFSYALPASVDTDQTDNRPPYSDRVQR